MITGVSMNRTITVRFSQDELFALYREQKTPATLNGYELTMLYTAHQKIEKALGKGN